MVMCGGWMWAVASGRDKCCVGGRVGGMLRVWGEMWYNGGMNWNPLYPSDEEVDPLEEAAREAEWEDEMRRMEGEEE